jgi:periplasmic divalent cation tolerance protein
VSEIRVLLMTAPSAAVAEAVVGKLVEEQLIACGNITMPITSVYRWQGAMEHADEVLVIMKTTRAAVAAVIHRVSELHPYDVPEVLSLPVEAGHLPYLEWVRASVLNDYE